MSKRKKKKINIFKLIKLIFLGLNIIFGFGLLLAFAAHYIKPSTSIMIAFSGFGFIYLLYVNLFFIFFWLFIKFKFSLISLLLVLLNINNIDRYFQLNASPKPPSCVNCIKVMSYNVKLFGLYDSKNETERDEKRAEILSYLEREQPDIVCFQEYFYDKSGKLNFNTTDTIFSILKLRDENNYFTHFPYQRKGEYYYGYATFSKYRIVNTGVVFMPDSHSVAATFIDFRYKGDTIRTYNIHLASNYFDPVDYETGKQIIENNEYDSVINQRARLLLRKMKNALLKRETQSDVIQQHIAESPYNVIVCGDLNDPPASYSYKKISRNLKDSFRESGKGQGKTFHGEVYPGFRIDNIFHSKEFNSYGHTIGTDLSTSDHYPIYCNISLLKKR